MLNRRYLRIKAMQRLFAFHQSKQSEYQSVLDDIKASHSIEALAETPIESEVDKLAPEEVADAFKQYVLKNDAVTEYSEEVNQKAKLAVEEYQLRVQKDLVQQRKSMLAQVEGIPENFRSILSLLVVLYDYAWSKKHNQTSKPKSADHAEPAHRAMIDLIRDHPQLREKVDLWFNMTDQVRQWYKELKDDPGFQLDADLDFETDKKNLKEWIKALFKSESFQTFYEQKELFWQEDKAIIKSLLTKTIKSAAQGVMELAPLSYNWEEDLSFFEDIFDATLSLEKETEAMIAGKAENWDVDRFALLDRVLLKMALAEMINFPGIPVKVTINEYIEISKLYSTPKSKGFINGLLDVLGNDLVAQGRIKKSGRGLIDNK